MAKIVATGHTGVEMNLGESCSYVLNNHRLGIAHSLLFWQLAPRVRSQVISTEDKFRFIESGSPYMLQYKVTELKWPHPRIAAKLVYLIAGRFDQ